MAVKHAPRSLPDTYFRLVKAFPLSHLRNDADLEAAEAIIDRLLQDDLDEGAQAYLDVLTDLVESAVEQALLPAIPIITRRHLVVVAAVQDPVVNTPPLQPRSPSACSASRLGCSQSRTFSSLATPPRQTLL